MSTPYFILSTLRSLVSIEKSFWTFGQEVQAETRQKKITVAGIFGNIFLFYMVFNVPVIILEKVAILLQNVVYDVKNKF